MGLDTTHGAWHGAYSAFNTWRTEIAKCLGIPLQLMEGFYPRKDDNDFMHPLSLVIFSVQNSTLGAKEQLERVTNNFPLLWDAFKPNPIHELLYHSDCDGEIEWEKCKPIAEALKELLPDMPSKDFGGHIGNFKDKTKTFIDGLLLAHSKKENLEFH